MTNCIKKRTQATNYNMADKSGHHVYFEDGTPYKYFSHSNWYDTATPYQYCVRELKEIKNIIKSGQKLKIESYGNVHLISTLDEFKNWIENVFYGGFEKYVFESN